MRTTIAYAAIAAAANVLRVRRARRDTWMLEELSDAQLKDIGLRRFDIWCGVHTAKRSHTD